VQLIKPARDKYQLEIPAMLLSGDTLLQRINEARASGLVLLHKPIHPAKIRVALHQLINTNLYH